MSNEQNRIQDLEQALRHCLGMMRHVSDGLPFPSTRRYVLEMVERYEPLVAEIGNAAPDESETV